MNQIKQQKLLKLIFFLSILGIFISGYLTYVHYSTLNAPCDFSETFQCSLVSRSKYAEFFGAPVAILGLLGYTILGLISFLLYKTKLKSNWLKENKILKKIGSARMLFFFSVIGLAISGYLTYAEFFLIKALCLFCLVSQAIILTIAIISYYNNKLNNKLNNT